MADLGGRLLRAAWRAPPALVHAVASQLRVGETTTNNYYYYYY